ncbi:MAG: primosomal protein N' [Cellvibrionaceae bacterium]
MLEPKSLQIALSSPFRKTFDYLSNQEPKRPLIGSRVSLPFGNQKNIMGIAVGFSNKAEPPQHKLRPIHDILDKEPVFDQEMLDLCRWCADYYHYPLGEVCHLALPALLRKPEPMPVMTETIWQITPNGEVTNTDELKRAPKQLNSLEAFQANRQLTNAELKQKAISASTLKALAEKGLIEKQDIEPSKEPLALPKQLLNEPPLTLNEEQQQAVNAIGLSTFSTYLLDGVTGSGKTEVYLQAIEKALKQDKQILVLVPEIGLTPQTVSRFEKRFNLPIVTLHSGLTDKQRFIHWQASRHNQIKIIIGTRSSIFTQLPELGLIVVDEEHDLSYKQQEGVRYSARDLAIVRAQKLNIPLILGSATPSLESLQNALSGRYQHLPLRQRANKQTLPSVNCVPTADTNLDEIAITEINQALARNQQVLIFINRRGYAPALICQDCGWISQCPNCDSRMTIHQRLSARQGQQLHCHHCDTKAAVPQQCGHCHSRRLKALGTGTQRSEEQLEHLFPQTPVLRIDRDSVSKKGQLESALTQINSGKPCIMVGTQMLAKGHHFANLGLAVILGLDSAFFSSDFRGAERMGQLLTQVSGRAGRENIQGKVLIQTQFSDHPLLQQLLQEGYRPFAETLLSERKISAMPPYEHLAVIRCHAHQPELAQTFLQQARKQAEQILPGHNGLQYLGPFPAAMEKRNNRYHSILQIKAANRGERQHLLKQLCEKLENTRIPKGLHWLVDVDPQEF